MVPRMPLRKADVQQMLQFCLASLHYFFLRNLREKVAVLRK